MRALSFYLGGPERPGHLSGFSISASGLQVFGVSTILGCGFAETDDAPGSDRKVVLSYPFWERTCGSDPRILGRSLSLDNESCTSIGVCNR
jgi:hypothetical protein